MTKHHYTMASMALLSWGILSTTNAADLYVNPSGLDSNSGLKDNPVASLKTAKEKVRAFAGKEAVTVHIADGIYYLPETLVFSPEDSGSDQASITYKAVNEGGAILSGGAKLELTWSAYKDGIFKAKTPEGLNIDQLFINDENQRMARYPNYDATKKTSAYQGYSADAFSPKRAAKWADPTGGYIHAMHSSRWGGYHYRITGKDTNNEVTYEGGWQNNRQMGMHKTFRMVENIFEELDTQGEWFHNAKENTLYYYPVDGVDLQTAKVEVVRLRHLIEFKGTEAQPVKNISLQGFVVTHAARTFMDTKEPLLRSDWAIYRGGAILLTGTENIQILDTEFNQVGGNAVFVNNYNRKALVKGCHIHAIGGSGVAFVGDPNAVRDPLFEYHEKNDLTKLDRTPGPKTNNYPADSIIEDCLIHNIGLVERQPAGVQVSMAQGITMRDLSVYDTARSGINIGDGTWGGHMIDRCDVFSTVLETHDHGSFNSWGRDRFWHSDREASQVEIDKDPTMPFWDATHTTTIRNSRWRCDHGWDIDLDDGSTNYDIYNNLMLSGGLKLREGFRRRAWNNITVHNGFHPHVWYNNCNDEVYNNIFMAKHKAARITKTAASKARVDENFFGADTEAAKGFSKSFGWDKNSAYGDPMFIDPANGDFRVKDGSPALKLGFKNFPMDQFGVKKPSLKAIARTPNLSAPAPKSKQKSKNQRPAGVGKWMGATLNQLSGDEFSAYGVSKEDGGVALTDVSEGSKATQVGLLKGDLIQTLNGQSTANLRQISQLLKHLKSEKITLKVVRNQKAMELELAADKNFRMEAAPKK